MADATEVTDGRPTLEQSHAGEGEREGVGVGVEVKVGIGGAVRIGVSSVVGEEVGVGVDVSWGCVHAPIREVVAIR